MDSPSPPDQLSLTAFDETPKHELAREQLIERREREAELDEIGEQLSELETLVSDEPLFDTEEWAGFSSENKRTVIRARLSILRDELGDELDGEEDDEADAPDRPLRGFQ